MTIEHSPIEVSQAVSDLREQLSEQDIPFSRRVGKSALQGSDVELRVYFKEEPGEEARANVPKTFEGYPVNIVVTGPIDAQA